MSERDILERLRERDANAASLLDTMLHREAAAEIERLRERIAEMSALAEMLRARVDTLIQIEVDQAGREALAAHL